MKQLLALVTIWLIAFPVLGQAPAADLALLNGRVVTSDPARPTAQALAIRQDRILAVGSVQEVEKFVTARTRKIDLAGRTVIAGFNDADNQRL